MTHKVDFLGIGVQKAATSWLWQNLRHHPDIWVPPQKELHYFDRSPKYSSPSYLASKHLIHRLVGLESYNKRFKTLLINKLRRAIESKDWERISWYLRYCLGTYNDDWYLSLFEFGEGKIKGEITPSYSILDLEDVKQIEEILPELKIILVLRNPIERAWSHIRYDWTRQLFDNISNAYKIKSFIEAPDQTLRSDYVRMLKIWSSCFPREQIYVGFYDDVVHKPQEIIQDILEFLGVKNLGNFNNTAINRKVNVSKKMNIPSDVQYYLANKYYPELQKLNDLVGGHSVVWLKEAEKILSATQKGDIDNCQP